MCPQLFLVYSPPQEGSGYCLGSGIENHAMYGARIYAHRNSDLYVNLLIPQVLNWSDKGLMLTEQTQFSFAEKSELTLTLEKATVDKVAPGEQQPESDHHFQGKQTDIGVFKDVHYRRAMGWFSYDLKNKDKAAKKLRVTYHNADKNVSFRLYLNNTLIKNVTFDQGANAGFFDEYYALPKALQSNEILTVQFEATGGGVAGNIYDVRLMR